MNAFGGSCADTLSAASRSSRANNYPPETVRRLNALTSDFYAREAASFSATRLAPWHGWEKAWGIIATHDPVLATLARVDGAHEGELPSVTEPLAVLDLGCGNLRFERFLAKRVAGPVRVVATDNCPDLSSPAIGTLPAAASRARGKCPGPARAKKEDAPGREASPFDGVAVEFRALDIVEALLDGTFADRLPHGTCDLAVAFGLMHHLPTFALRARLIEGLLGSLRPGGFAILSFWQLLNDPRLAAKAVTTTAEGRAALRLPAFRENDFLLGWQHAEGVYRFCHHTPEAEIDALLGAVREPGSSAHVAHASVALPFREIARFSADGKRDDLNRYLVLRRL